MRVGVILCGGVGSRLWPVSRELHPKPFMRMADGQSLLQKAFLRGAALPFVDTSESTYIPAGRKHRLGDPGIPKLAVTKVQSGAYLGEDDVVRFEYVCGRAAP